jgi:hypothetical protein
VKKILFGFLAIMALNGCSRSPEDKIRGTWVNFDQYQYYGLREITFSDGNLKINQYQYGGDSDVEIVREYKIVDDIIFIKNYTISESYRDRPYYNYSIIGNKLFLSGYYGIEIFTRKTERNIVKTRNNLMGNWFLVLNNKKVELSFGDNDVTVIQYDENGNIGRKSIAAYELDEHYLKIENLENTVDDFYFYRGVCLYSISKDVLCLLTCVTGNWGDVVETEPLYFEKQ